MAIHAHSTTVPAFQRGLLRPALTDATSAHDFSPATIMARDDEYAADQAKRAAARPPIDDPRTTDELLEEISREIGRQDGVGTADPVATSHASALASESLQAGPLAAHESTASQPCDASGLAAGESLPHRGSVRRGAPRSPYRGGGLMGQHFIPPRPYTLPPHILRRKLEAVIADAQSLLCLLDEEEGIDPDLMEELEAVDEDGDALDRGEGDLMENAEDDDPAEETSLETFGRGFVRCGADDAEEDDEPERDDECGSEDGEDIGHHASQFSPRPLTTAQRAELRVIAARAAIRRRVLHV